MLYKCGTTYITLRHAQSAAWPPAVTPHTTDRRKPNCYTAAPQARYVAATHGHLFLLSESNTTKPSRKHRPAARRLQRRIPPPGDDLGRELTRVGACPS